MQYPDRFADLPAYAFPRLRALLDAHPPGAAPVDMSIGAPRHPFPDWVSEIIAAHAAEFQPYPPNEGTPELLDAIRAWLQRRYGVAMAQDNVMALNGTREGLYNVAAALCPERKAGARPAVLLPNPFYQVYAVAALSVGAEPVYVPATAETKGMIGDDLLARCRPGTIILNTARGEIVDEAALIRAMDEKGIRAGLDVFNDEPGAAQGEFDSALARHPNVYGTHHIGASTEQAQNAIAAEVVRMLDEFGRGNLLHCVNL